MAFGLVKKLIAGTAIVSLISVLTKTGASFSFTGTVPDVASEQAKTFIGRASNIIDETDFKDDEEVSQMAAQIKEEANAYASREESLKEFQKVSLVRVVDGDTIVVDIDGDSCGSPEHEYKVRLIGVNTPESVASQEYLDKTGTTNSEEGKTASNFTKCFLENYDYVYLEKDVSEEDIYGRLLRYVWIEVPTDSCDLGEISTNMLNGVLLKEGMAKIATYQPDTKYEEEFETIAAEYENSLLDY